MTHPHAVEDEGAPALIRQHLPVTHALGDSGVTRTLQLSIIEELRRQVKQRWVGAVVLYQLGYLK